MGEEGKERELWQSPDLEERLRGVKLPDSTEKRFLISETIPAIN